ncbi:Crp/Fnr family transcriptional regulator [Nigerium sp.]|uniref:Crp/Fnr family transcriptional regulator n=1 Tax=Nigerium sp. TaxID=2042655 RepID=UPI00322221E6
MAEASREHDRCVARVPIFAGLSEGDQDLVTGLARPLLLRAGEEAYAGSGDGPRLLVVHAGRLTVYRPAADGGERLLRVLGPGDFTGEEAVLTGRPSRDGVRAVEDTRLCSFSHRELTALLGRHSRVAVQLLASVAARLGEAEDRLDALTSRDVVARLAGYLLGLPVTHASDGPWVALPIPKKDVASLLDTTPESLSRALGRLASRGTIVIDGSRVALADPDALLALAGE